ncbi:MAG: hypothetical protein CR991_08460 [Proteobacteria bacterium]|nr:MAG: hypothetical protein CR991_08460 [Pseudomonadota bacterium]
MNPSIYEIKQVDLGRLFIMPCPDGDSLQADLSYYRTLGIRKVVSLLEVREAENCGVAQEEQLCQTLGLEFMQYPIRDRRAPTDQRSFKKIVTQLYSELRSGKNIAIHCYAGIGRTGVLSACLLIKDGMTPQEAVELLSQKRGCDMPQTQEQYDFLIDYEPNTGSDSDTSKCGGFWRRLFA